MIGFDRHIRYSLYCYQTDLATIRDAEYRYLIVIVYIFFEIVTCSGYGSDMFICDSIFLYRSDGKLIFR